MLIADDAQDQDLQQILADLVRTVGGIPHLVEHLRKEVCDQRLIAEITEDLYAGFFVCRLEGDALHSDDIVLQWGALDRLLRVFHVWGDDDQVPRSDMILFVVEEEVPLPVYHEEKLGEMMCVENALPVLFVLGQRNGQKTGIQLVNVCGLDSVLSVTHRSSPLLRCFGCAPLSPDRACRESGLFRL